MALNFWKCITGFRLNSINQNVAPQFFKTIRPLFYRKYCALVSTNENFNSFLEFLNSSSPETLMENDLSPLLIQKIINGREIKNLTIEDMPFLGLNREKRFLIRRKLSLEDISVEKFQTLIQDQSQEFTNNSPTYVKSKALKTNNDSQKSYRKKSIFYYTTPNLTNYNLENVQTISAVSLSITHMCVTTIRVGEIEDMKIIPLFINLGDDDSKKLNQHDICEKVLMATQHLPKSDLLIFEKLFISSRPNESKALHMIQHMFLATTDRYTEENDLHSTIFVSRSLVSRLFKLEISSERISCIGIGESILTGKRPFKWIPPLTFSTVPLRRYILSTREEKLIMIESLLLAIAFNSVYLKNRLGLFISD